MRFGKDGPAIPDDLLNARDEGRVVFFCGAGVSRARAGLPDFFGLAEDVIRDLGVGQESDARKVLEKAREVGEQLSVTGLISADRIFGLLERDFSVADIQRAVAKALTKPDVDVSAHDTLLRLSTTRDSQTLLVTTNFDRLFEACNSKAKIHQPPRLPHLSRYDDLNGIVYLHGRVNEDDTGADGSGFVLSSSDFGYAYLSEGWATEFFREVVERYVVVFVGYSADDPPINYLLEGLRRTTAPSHRLYAFQSDESMEVVARWNHRQVTAIPYSSADKHRALWDSLELWAQRADDPDLWRRNILDAAMEGPECLKPHQRGQIAHIISTDAGAREFAAQSPPATWLCVMDPTCRYARPDKLERIDPNSPRIDPFVQYSIDSDVTPERSDEENPYAEPKVPASAWDAFIVNRLDRQGLPLEGFAAFRGPCAAEIPRLPKRVAYLCNWIAKVANQPAIVWWAAQQSALHPYLRNSIEWQLKHEQDQFSAEIVSAWRYLLESWNASSQFGSIHWYEFRTVTEREGWSIQAARTFAELTRPRLKVGPAMLATSSPPNNCGEIERWQLLQVEVECPDIGTDVEVPDAWLEPVTRMLRRNLELVAELCDEVGDPSTSLLSPIIPDDREGVGNYDRHHGISGLVLYFVSLFSRLARRDMLAAQREYSSWRVDDEAVFGRLRVWAAAQPLLETPLGFCNVVLGLSNSAFWNHDHQRDLLLGLRARWQELSLEQRKQLEGRLLEGPERWEGEDTDAYEERHAYRLLNRLQWLMKNGCEFSFDVQTRIGQLRRIARQWVPEAGQHAADSREIRGGSVVTNTEHENLVHGPIATVLLRARQAADSPKDDFLTEHDPFAGLCVAQPRRAYLALSRAARKGDYPGWAWRTFLSSPRRKEDAPHFTVTIAERLCRLPDPFLQQSLYWSTNWLKEVSTTLSKEASPTYEKIVRKLIDVIYLDPSEARSAVLSSGNERDWATAAINSAVGHIGIAVLRDSRIEHLDGSLDSTSCCLQQLVRLLDLRDDLRRYAIAINSHHLGWLHRVASAWTEEHLLTIIAGDDHGDKSAFWSGFFWNPKITSIDLFSHLKLGLLSLAKQRGASRDRHVQTIAYLLVWGWNNTATDKESRLITNDEFREALLGGGDLLRSHVVWQFERAMEDATEEDLDVWLTKSTELFTEVWPRQRSAKNEAMSICLVEFLFRNVQAFPKLAEGVRPHLTKIEERYSLYFDEKVKDIIVKHPDSFLDVLVAILSQDVTTWPYGVGDALTMLGESNTSHDKRYVELARKWNAR
ncbi:SIR2 family protein [Aeoliella sp.]|uniref:SIR2 family protein n=1 Tax=Aeoliella sp. TaxID=2795800 RepID=UPI003CCBC0EF